MKTFDYALLESMYASVCKERDALRALYAAPALPSVPDEASAYAMGAKGGPVVEAERLAFEAWMKGHCWALSAEWDGTSYRGKAEHGEHIDYHAVQTRRIWAAWRDRAALAAPKPGEES